MAMLGACCHSPVGKPGDTGCPGHGTTGKIDIPPSNSSPSPGQPGIPEQVPLDNSGIVASPASSVSYPGDAESSLPGSSIGQSPGQASTGGQQATQKNSFKQCFCNTCAAYCNVGSLIFSIFALFLPKLISLIGVAVFPLASAAWLIGMLIGCLILVLFGTGLLKCAGCVSCCIYGYSANCARVAEWTGIGYSFLACVGWFLASIRGGYLINQIHPKYG
jgi:hypothetical protein